jgi:hypothetical protein
MDGNRRVFGGGPDGKSDGEKNPGLSQEGEKAGQFSKIRGIPRDQG